MNTQEKPFYKKWWVWVIGIFIFLGFIGSGGGKTVPSLPLTQPDPSLSKNSTTTPVEQKQYVEVAKFNGNGTKKSEPFTIQGSRFKVVYDCSGDASMTYCGAFVYKVGSKLPQGIMNSPQAVKDETVIYTSLTGKGEYYIDANVLGNFTMTIYDYK